MRRRNFLQLLSLVSGSTLLSSCGSEQEQKRLISYLVPPEEGVVPGEALWYHGTCTECPAGCGAKARVREGWPVKLEGIPEHPISDGALCIRGQASLWRLYHPERFREPLLREANGRLRPVPWDRALGRVREELSVSREQGKGSLWLSGRTTGTLAEVLGEVCRELEVERLPEFEPLGQAALRRAYHRLFGRDDLPAARIGEADLLLSIGTDLLETYLSPVAHARSLSRRPEGAIWTHLEAHRSLSGANADRRLLLKPGGEPFLIGFLLLWLAAEGRLRRPLPEAVRQALPGFSREAVLARTGLAAADLEDLARKLAGAERPLLLAGGAEGGPGAWPAAVLTALLQWGMGMDEATLDFSAAENYGFVGAPADLLELAGRLEAGSVGVLFFSRCNPVLHLTGTVDFRSRLERARFRVVLADLPDETTESADLILPLSHGFESWGDAEPRRGLRTLLRPAVKPLHDTRSEGEVLLTLLERVGEGKGKETFSERLFRGWRERYMPADLERFLERGFVAEPVAKAPLELDATAAAALAGEISPQPAPQGTLLLAVPSLRRFDGRSRPLPLLDEIPDPLTTVSYGTWVAMSPERARREGLAESDQVELKSATWSARLTVKLQPGLAQEVLTAHWESLPNPHFGIDPKGGDWIGHLTGVSLARRGRDSGLAIMAGSPSQHGRGLIPEPVHHQDETKKEEHGRASRYPEHDHPGYRWAMAIDLQRCIGCSACAAACYMENNVPVVGQKEHLKGREMSWLRIEPFYDGEGKVEFLPMLCQHCHYAPCEPVCPVYAAYHNPEGLNIQVYDRCVGTRYCSNNCPYKVRRFNWWPHRRSSPLVHMTNPDLSVRKRGMMEKCTFCIQRIRAARLQAREEGRPIRDGEVIPACAQTCPRRAIVFGNLNDEGSEVLRWSRSGRAYRVFAELGTESSVYYLKPERS